MYLYVSVYVCFFVYLPMCRSVCVRMYICMYVCISSLSLCLCGGLGGRVFSLLVPEMEITCSVETEGGTGATDPKVIAGKEEKLAHR